MLHCLNRPRHSNSGYRINGLTHMNMTKLDVLSGLDEIKVGLRYRAKDGTILTSVPADLNVLEGVTVSSRAAGPSEWEAGHVDCGNLGQGHWQRHTAEVLNAWRAQGPPMMGCGAVHDLRLQPAAPCEFKMS